MMWKLFGTAALIVLAGCVSTEQRAVAPSPSEPPPVASPALPAEGAQASRTPQVTREGFSWARSDGQRISGNAELTARARADLIECKADAPPRVAVGAGGEACMKEKGYYVRAVD